MSFHKLPKHVNVPPKSIPSSLTKIVFLAILVLVSQFDENPEKPLTAASPF
jgi:hypothetical protein